MGFIRFAAEVTEQQWDNWKRMGSGSSSIRFQPLRAD